MATRTHRALILTAYLLLPAALPSIAQPAAELLGVGMKVGQASLSTRTATADGLLPEEASALSPKPVVYEAEPVQALDRALARKPMERYLVSWVRVRWTEENAFYLVQINRGDAIDSRHTTTLRIKRELGDGAAVRASAKAGDYQFPIPRRLVLANGFRRLFRAGIPPWDFYLCLARVDRQGSGGWVLGYQRDYNVCSLRGRPDRTLIRVSNDGKTRPLSRLEALRLLAPAPF